MTSDPSPPPSSSTPWAGRGCVTNPIRKEVQIGDCRLLLGDMRAILPTLVIFDLCLTDPPYGIGEDGGRFRDRKGGGHRVLPKKGWDKETPSQADFDVIMAHSKAQIIWGGNYFTDKLPPSKGWLYWQKLMGGDFSDGELAWTSLDSALREYTYCNKGGGKQHPTQKPVPLFEWCLDRYPATSVIDPYMGSGTAIVASLKRGVPATGIEIDEDYFEIAVQRARETLSPQTGLFAPKQESLFGGEAA